MNKELFTKIMTATAKIYDKELDQETLELWLQFFKEDNIDNFKNAMDEHIRTNNKFPTIADIKSNIYKNTHIQINNNELWDALVKAISRSSYYAEEEFDKLPELVKRYVRSPYQLQEMASMDSDVIHSVVKGQFMKQIEKIKEDYKSGEIVGRKNNLLQEKGIYKLEEMIEDEYR
jgi:hypothetical protein